MKINEPGNHTFTAYKIGRLSFLYSKGHIRTITNNSGTELIRGIYAAVRDKNWGTIPCRIVHEKIDWKVNILNIHTILHFAEGDIELRASIHIVVHEEGTIKYEFTGIPLTDFYKNRIGINVLLPIENTIGQECLVTDPAGICSTIHFPENIAPDQPFLNIKQLQWGKGDNISIAFDGDIFEMEDQRNWTDASFKIYSTPLDLPFPALIRRSENIFQSVNIKIDTIIPTAPCAFDGDEFNFSDKPVSIPCLGLSKSRYNHKLLDSELEILKELPLEYLYLVCDVDSEMSREDFFEAITLTQKKKIKIIIAFFLPGNYQIGVYQFLYMSIKKSGQQVLSVELYSKETFISPGNLCDIYIDNLRSDFPAITIGGGTFAHYAELNRSHGLSHKPDYYNFSLTPQVHAFDDLTLIENLKGIEYAARDAHDKLGKPIYISPITLKQRMNFVATDMGVDDPRNIPENKSDFRQSSPFGALWTLGAILALARAEVKYGTFYETSGSLGIMDRQPNSKKNHTNDISRFIKFPVYGIFREISGLRHLSILPLIGYPYNHVDGFRTTSGELWIWNYTDSRIKIPHLRLREKGKKFRYDFNNFTWEINQDTFLEKKSLYKIL